MNPFEKALLNEIPADEAADFFLRVTGRDKLAQAGINSFVGERAELLVKHANNMMAMPGPGMSGGAAKVPGAIPAPAAPMLSPSAQGQNTVMQGGAGSSKLGSEDVTVVKEKKAPLTHRMGETVGRHGETINAVGGSLYGGSVGGGIGAAMGYRLHSHAKDKKIDKLLSKLHDKRWPSQGTKTRVERLVNKGVPGKAKALMAALSLTGAAAGGASGALLGRGTGRFMQGVSQGSSHAHKSKYDGHKEAMKFAFDGAGGMPSPGTPDDEPTIDQYMMAEQQGQQAEEQQGAEYFKQRFQQASQQLQETQAQASQTQEQAQQLEQQVAQSDQQVQSAMQQAQMASQSAQQNIQSAHEMAMQATSQAMESQAEVLKQKQLAAAMRMGVQQLKDNVMGAMANDPTEQLAQQLQAPPPGSAGVVGQNPQQPQPAVDPATGQPMPQDPAAAGQDPNAAAAGGAPPEAAQAGGEAPAAPAKKSEPKPKEKSEKKDDKKGGGTEVTVKHSAMQFQALAQMFRAAV